MTDHKALRLVDVLRDQRQCDDDGVMCIVSRQAVDEAVQIIEALTAAPAASEGEDGAVAWIVPSARVTSDGSYEDGPESLVFESEATDYIRRIGAPLYTRPTAQVAATPKHDEGRVAELEAEVERLRHWNESVSVCPKHTADIVSFDGCVLCALDEYDPPTAALATQPAARRVTDGDAWRWVSERAWFVDAAAHAFDLRFGPGDFSTEPRNADADDVREAIFAAMREEAGPEAEESRESFAQPAEGVSGG